MCRGTSVVLICPADGMEAIANPFVQQEWWESESKRSSRTRCFQFCTILAANVEMMTSWKITMKCKYCHQTLVIKLTFLSFYAVGRHTCTVRKRWICQVIFDFIFSKTQHKRIKGFQIKQWQNRFLYEGQIHTPKLFTIFFVPSI